MGRRKKRNADTRAVKLASPDGRPGVGADAPLPDLGPLKPTPVYNTYWRFAAERQNVFFRRVEGRPPPWTHDPVIRAHKFTNAYRASDRVSQYLIRRVIYRADLPDDLVYWITRTLFESLPALSDSLPSLRQIDIEHVQAAPVPLHPGAARFYRERELFP